MIWKWYVPGPETMRDCFSPTGPVGCGIKWVSAAMSGFWTMAVAKRVPALLVKPIVPASNASLFDGSVHALTPGGRAFAHFGLVYTSLIQSNAATASSELKATLLSLVVTRAPD